MKYLLFSALSLIATLAINAQSQTFKYDRVGDFKEGMAQVFVGSKFGFIDISGKEVIPPIYEDNFPHYEFKDGFIVLKKDNLLGIIDKTGKVIAPFEFKSIGSFSNGIAEATKPGTKVGFIDPFGKTVIPFQYDIFILLGGVKCIDGMIPVQNNTNKKGYIHKTGNLVVPFKYEEARNFSNGLGLVKRVFNGKVSYLNNFGASAIPEKYDDGRDFIDGFAAVNLGAKQTPTYELSGGKWGLIDKSGKEVVPFIYDRIYENKNGFAIVANGKYPNEKKGLIKADGKVILPVEFNDIKMLNGRLIAKKEFGGPYALFEMDGNKITDFKWYFSDAFADFCDGLIAVRELVNGKLGKTGVIDLNGVLKIPYSYDIIGNFKEGLAQVASNNKYGAIDKNGKVVIPLVYDYLYGFSEGWSGVTKNGKSGFVNKSGKMLEFYKSTISSSTLPIKKASPEPQESKYQSALSKANNSKERAAAINEYYFAIKQLGYTAADLESLLGDKFLQMCNIDYYGIYDALMSKTLKNDDVKFYLKTIEVLTSEQRAAIRQLAKYSVDDFTAMQNNTPKPAYPAGVPKPGFGWGKNITSNISTPSTDNSNNKTALVSPPKPTDQLTILKNRAKYFQGQMVYLSLQKTSYFLPNTITVNNLSDAITLVGIGAKYTYSSYYGRNEFGVTSLSNVTQTIKLVDLINMVDRVSGAYIVSEMGPCFKCSGQGSSWNNQNRSRSYCTNCNATGCVPKTIFNGGSIRTF